MAQATNRSVEFLPQGRCWLVTLAEPAFEQFRLTGGSRLALPGLTVAELGELDRGDGLVLQLRERGLLVACGRIGNVAPGDGRLPNALRMRAGSVTISAEPLDLMGLLPYLRCFELFPSSELSHLLQRPLLRLGLGDFELIQCKLGQQRASHATNCGA